MIHPIHGAYMKYKKGSDWLSEIEGHFFGLSRLLGHNQVPYHYGDENLMKKYARVEGDRIKVGLCTYDAVVVPFTYTLDHETADMLKEYMANGGKVWLYKDAPECIDGLKADMDWLKANITWEDLLAKRDARISVNGENVSALRKMTRKLEDGSSLIYITNISADDFDCVKVGIPGAKTVCEIDLEGDGVPVLKPVHGEVCEKCGGRIVYLRFEDAQSHLLLVNPTLSDDKSADVALEEGVPAIPEAYIPVPERAAFAKKPENMMVLDTAMLSRDGVNYDEPLSIYGIKDNLLREQWGGRVWIKYTFTAADGYRTDDLRLVVEPMGQDSVTVNGVEVAPSRENWWFDRNFASVNIAPYVRAGVNEVIVALNHWQRDYVYYVLYSGVSESLRNCLVFDTEIEAAYLVGDFALETAGTFTDDVKNSRIYEGDFVLTGQKDSVAITDVVKDGYPFFGGHMNVKFSYDYKAGDATVLALTGRFATASVKVNGVCAGDMLFLRHVDLAEYLREGENEIEIDFANAMRNLMGPHHRHDPEPTGVGPGTFSFEKEWHGRECKGYLDRYAFVRFGVEGK